MYDVDTREDDLLPRTLPVLVETREDWRPSFPVANPYQFGIDSPQKRIYTELVRICHELDCLLSIRKK